MDNKRYVAMMGTEEGAVIGESEEIREHVCLVACFLLDESGQSTVVC